MPTVFPLTCARWNGNPASRMTTGFTTDTVFLWACALVTIAFTSGTLRRHFFGRQKYSMPALLVALLVPPIMFSSFLAIVFFVVIPMLTKQRITAAPVACEQIATTTEANKPRSVG
jgi:hypothetical protein